MMVIFTPLLRQQKLMEREVPKSSTPFGTPQTGLFNVLFHKAILLSLSIGELLMSDLQLEKVLQKT